MAYRCKVFSLHATHRNSSQYVIRAQAASNLIRAELAAGRLALSGLYLPRNRRRGIVLFIYFCLFSTSYQARSYIVHVLQMEGLQWRRKNQRHCLALHR